MSGELPGEKWRARRGRRGRRRLRELRRRKVAGRYRGLARLPNPYGPRHHKNRCRREVVTALLAAGHRAVAHAAAAMVLAIRWRFLCTSLLRTGGLWFRVSVRYAHAALTALHSIHLPRRRPQWGPQQRHCQQAHPRPQFSRSDRNGPRPLHSWSWKNTPNRTLSPNQFGREALRRVASPQKHRNPLAFLDLLPPRAANSFYATYLYSI
jgi:hypothetical protein